MRLGKWKEGKECLQLFSFHLLVWFDPMRDGNHLKILWYDWLNDIPNCFDSITSNLFNIFGMIIVCRAFDLVQIKPNLKFIIIARSGCAALTFSDSLQLTWCRHRWRFFLVNSGFNWILRFFPLFVKKVNFCLKKVNFCL